MEREHHGIAWGVVAAGANSLVAICIKLTGNVPYETMVFFRFAVAFLFLIPAVVGGKVVLHWKFVPKHCLRALAGVASIYCYFYSVTKLPLVNAVTLSNMTPLFLPFVIFIWMRKVIPMVRIVALCVGFVGVVLIIKPDAVVRDVSTLVGMVGAMFSAVALVGVRQLSKTESTETIMAYYFLIAIVVLFAPMAFTWQSITSGWAWFYLVTIGVFSAIYQFCLVRSLTHLPTTKAGAFNYLSVVFSGLFGWWLFKEVPDWFEIGGIALIIVGGLAAVMSQSVARNR
jgi:drug/metabolite transporter (DMT)-like permease